MCLSDFFIKNFTIRSGVVLLLTVKTKNPRKFLAYKGEFYNSVAPRGSFSNPFLSDLKLLAAS